MNDAEYRTATLGFLLGLQRADGGYANQVPETSSSLQSTLSVLKSLRLLTSQPVNPMAALSFVSGCFHEPTGGFCDRAGIGPSVFATAMGLIVRHELAQEDWAGRARARQFINDHASTGPEHFMNVAVYDELGRLDPVPTAAIEFFQNQKQPDGSFGASVFGNAVALSALLRAGVTVDAKSVVRLLLAAQGPDGGFGERGAASDLFTTYAVMRTLTLLRLSPDTRRLSVYLDHLQSAGGGYRSSPSDQTSANASYQALSIRDWIGRNGGEA